MSVQRERSGVSRRPSSTRTGTGKRILVVDDDRDNADSLVRLLEAEGHECRGCYSGDEALAALRDFDADAVLMDINMPGRNGWETAREIRRRSTGKRPVLIAITGERKGPGDLAFSKMVGFDHYLLKPADPQTLRALIGDAEKNGK